MHKPLFVVDEDVCYLASQKYVVTHVLYCHDIWSDLTSHAGLMGTNTAKIPITYRA